MKRLGSSLNQQAEGNRPAGASWRAHGRPALALIVPATPLLAAVVVAAATALPAAAAMAQEGVSSSTADHAAAWLDWMIHWTTRTIEVGGIAVIVVGILAATATYFRRRIGGGGAQEPYREFRSSLGRSILLGLEFLVAADIIATVAIEATLTSVAVLAGIVLIRTFLSFALEVEIEGRWPWQRSGE